MTDSQLRGLRIVARANARARLPSTARLRDEGVHPLTTRSMCERGWIELHLPDVGTDGFRLTEAGAAALRDANASLLRARLRALRRTRFQRR